MHRLVELGEAALVRRQDLRRERHFALTHARPADHHRRAAVTDRSLLFVAVAVPARALAGNADDAPEKLIGFGDEYSLNDLTDLAAAELFEGGHPGLAVANSRR